MQQSDFLMDASRARTKASGAALNNVKPELVLLKGFLDLSPLHVLFYKSLSHGKVKTELPSRVRYLLRMGGPALAVARDALGVTPIELALCLPSPVAVLDQLLSEEFLAYLTDLDFKELLNPGQVQCLEGRAVIRLDIAHTNA